MGVKLVSASAGSVEIVAPATASNFVATMPAGTGNVVVNGINGAIVSGTAVASTSGTAIDFTGIPSWVKRITVMFSGVSTNGTSLLQIQLGDSGGVETTGYLSMSGARDVGGGALGASVITTGFVTQYIGAATSIFNGKLTLNNLSGNAWVGDGVGNNNTATAYVYFYSGSKTLSDTLDRVRITTANGTDTFDAGSINIMYE